MATLDAAEVERRLCSFSSFVGNSNPWPLPSDLLSGLSYAMDSSSSGSEAETPPWTNRRAAAAGATPAKQLPAWAPRKPSCLQRDASDDDEPFGWFVDPAEPPPPPPPPAAAPPVPKKAPYATFFGFGAQTAFY
jgi:hypothetical protein